MTTAIAEPKKPSAAPPIPADAGSPSANIAVSRIVPSPWNRKAEVTDELIESVRQDGVLQNVILRPHKATEEDVALYSMKADPFVIGESIFQLVAGERRWGAARKAGRSHVPAAVRQLSDIDAMRLQIKENEDRENLRPMERAEAYDRLRMLYMAAHAKDPGYTDKKCMEHVATTVNKEPRTVYQIIQLKKLIRDAQTCLRNGMIEASHGYELCGRSEEEQEQLLTWLKVQTTHSQGDVPSVRRLKLEIRNMDIAADEKRRQQALFKEEKEAAPPSVKFDVEFDGKRIDLIRGATLPISVQRGLLKAYPGLTTAQFLKDCRVQLAIGLNGKPFYLTVDLLQQVLTSGMPCSVTDAAQTSAPSAAAKPHMSHHATPAAKPPTKGYLKAEAKQREKEAKAQRDRLRNDRIEKKYKAAFFIALGSKARVCSRMLTRIIPDLLFDLWENNLPPEAFVQELLLWPAPKQGDSYSYQEIRGHLQKHTRKFSANIMAALLIINHLRHPETERLAKYFGVDVKKLRQKAATAVKEEEAKAALPKVPTTQKEKQLYTAVVAASPMWAKLRRTGASNPEIRDTLKILMGEDGGMHSQELGDVCYMGGNNPRVWLNTVVRGKKPPTLQGLDLFAAVRDLLKIPEKGDVDA